MPLYIRDYLGDTTHLTRAQHGSYLLICFAYWVRGSALPDNDAHLRAIAKCTTKEWQVDRETIAQLFITRDGVWWHKRIEAELAKAASKHQAKANAGARGAEKRWHRDSTAIADAPPSQSQTDAPSPSHSPSGESSLRSERARTAEEFETWWKEQPNKVGKPSALKAYQAARKRGATPTELIEGLRDYAARKPADRQWLNPATFLNQERWKDRPAAVNADAKRPRQTIDPDAFTAGIAGSLGLGPVDPAGTIPGDEGRTIDGDFSVVGCPDTGPRDGLRPGDDEPAGFRSRVWGAVPEPGEAGGDLPGNPGPPAGGLGGDSDPAAEIELDMGQSNAVSGGDSGVRARGFDEAQDAARPRRNGATESGPGEQTNGHDSTSPMGGTSGDDYEESVRSWNEIQARVRGEKAVA